MVILYNPYLDFSQTSPQQWCTILQRRTWMLGPSWRQIYGVCDETWSSQQIFVDGLVGTFFTQRIEDKWGEAWEIAGTNSL